MADEPKPQAWSKIGLRAWGNALVKTGTEHLDLPMVRQGKEALANAAKMPIDPVDTQDH